MANVFYQSTNELATLTNIFAVDGVLTDPDTVTLTITAPSGLATDYAYASAEITRSEPGVYTKDIPCPESGMWTYAWAGTGFATDTVTGNWTVFSSNRRQYYTSLEALKQHIKIDNGTRDEQLLQVLAAAARSIDEYCGRQFWPNTTATTRTYRAHGRVMSDADGEVLLVDDIASTVGLIVETGPATGEAWTPVTSYELAPDNAVSRGRPITGLRSLGTSWSTNIGHLNRIRITARWGWPAVPDAVVQATLLQAARFYKRKDSPSGVFGSADWGTTRISRMDPDVQALVGHLMLPGFA